MIYLRNVTKLTNYLMKSHLKNTLRRNIHRNCQLNLPATYDASGKTTVHVLNKDSELGIMVDACSQVGFRLNNGITVLGSMAIFPRSVLSWNVEDVSEITEDTLSLFAFLEPRLDILVIGVGDKLEDFNFYKKILPFTKTYKMSLEVLPTEQACATFNFLNSEGRNVAGALIPPKTLRTNEDDELTTKLRYQNLYEKD